MDPVNTILGDNKKLRVVVVNAENGKLNIVLI